MPVVPLAVMAGGAIISHFANKSAKNAALERTPEENLSLGGAQGGAKALTTGGAEQLNTGANTERPATNYYSTLLSGNRAAQAQATAAPAARISDIYGGAQRNLEQQGVRGATKDVATANLGRERASSLAGLVTGVQPAAAGALASIGESQQNRGASMTGAGTSAYGNLLGQGYQNRIQANKAGTDAASSVGQLVTGASKMVSDWYGGRNKSSSGFAGGGYEPNFENGFG